MILKCLKIFLNFILQAILILWLLETFLNNHKNEHTHVHSDHQIKDEETGKIFFRLLLLDLSRNISRDFFKFI
jgi:hypothetical protein